MNDPLQYSTPRFFIELAELRIERDALRAELVAAREAFKFYRDRLSPPKPFWSPGLFLTAEGAIARIDEILNDQA